MYVFYSQRARDTDGIVCDSSSWVCCDVHGQCTFIGTTPEKGNVRVAIIGEGERSIGAGITCDVNMRLSYCNK